MKSPKKLKKKLRNFLVKKNNPKLKKFRQKEKNDLEIFLQNSKLFQYPKGRDDIYNFNRNCPSRLDFLKYCEKMWNSYKPYCGDNHFINEFKDKLRQRWWELFLANSFLENGFSLEKSPVEGPDLKIKNKPTIWIEAISMTNGKTEDAVPESILNQISYPQTEKMLLRLTSGFNEKARKFQIYLDKGIVNPDDILIIAIDISGVDSAFLDDKEIPLACRAFFGIGELTMSIPIFKDKEEGEISTFYPPRKEIVRANGSAIPATGLFMNEFKFISGIITNSRYCTETERNPMSLKFFKNPNVENNINFSSLGFFRNIYYVEDGLLKLIENSPRNHLENRQR